MAEKMFCMFKKDKIKQMDPGHQNQTSSVSAGENTHAPAKVEKSLLLHICCAPCASGCYPFLQEAEREFCFYFSNSNLNSFSEYERRLDSARKLADLLQVKLWIDPYDHSLWLNHVSACENFQQQKERGPRCRYCFEFSLQRTAEMAKQLNMNFATSLTVSPHKDSNLIFSVGTRWDHFECWNFKKRNGFKISLENSQKFNLYRQNYCGCEFSLNRN